MYILSEDSVKKIATPELAFTAVSDAFIAAYKKAGEIFPVVIAKGCDPGNIFSIKSGHLSELRLSGLKVGSYWADNHLKGLSNHGTTTLLLDEATGRPHALINAGYLNGLRTAAANAVATHQLARKDAKVLSVLGAGHQAIFEVKALCRIRDIEMVLISSRSPASVARAVKELSAAGIHAKAADTESACRQADILTTVTNATAPLFDAGWIKPGTHISAMGADQSGKQELPLALLNENSLFADLPAQSRVIGEFELASQGNPSLTITAIGAVLTGEAEGRTSEADITIFDSSGIALQDLCVAKAVLDQAIEKGLATDVAF
ncbi:ornithine cyclodeaminase family protein [Porticoccaceae bacterium]|nr:ornithine cyclodeaminase family protein [Porticoccaceae bacterium]